MTPFKTQQGAALFVSLMILSIILILAVAAARYTTTNVKIAINEEIRLSAKQKGQAIIDGALIDGGNVAVRGSSGDSNCTATYANCTWYEINLPSGMFTQDVANGYATFRSVRGTPALIAPPRGLETSIRAFDAAPFELEGQFDKSSEREGRASINEGLLLLVPKY